MFDLYTNFDVIFLANLTDKIHYQIFDSLGRIVQVLVDNDGKTSTGVARTDNEGTPVAGIDQVLAYTYNVKGEVTEMKRDNNVDGKYDYREAYTLNANGNWIEKQVDLTNDGTFDRKEVYTKEADDGLVKTNFYNLVEGRDVLTKVEDYTLNTNNQRISVKVDTLGDGTTDSITRYDLDALGRVAKAYFDTDGDGTVDRIESYTKDANGDNLRVEIGNATGEIHTVRTYERDPLGRILKYDTDNGNDGTIDQRYEYVRDVHGNENAYTLYSYNAVTQQLELSMKAEKVFNELNQAESVSYSYPDSSRDYSITYTYDDYGQKLSELFSGARNARWDYTYNDDGSVNSRISYDANGVMISKTVYTEYDPKFGTSKTLEEYNAQNELLSVSQYIRAENGSLQATLIDMASDNGGIGSWDRFAFGDRGANSAYNTSFDFTQWSNEKLAELGTKLSRIVMANGATSELTLNPEVVAQISEGGLQVRGAADKNDILNLSGFEKATRSDVRGYDLYTASFDGEDLKLYVQANDSISVIIG